VMLSWPAPLTWQYALTTAGMILFWTMAIFGAIVVVHYLGRERPATVAVGRTARTVVPITSATKANRTSRPDDAVSGEDVLVPLHGGFPVHDTGGELPDGDRLGDVNVLRFGRRRMPGVVVEPVHLDMASQPSGRLA
jgi:hypothetical protein